MPRTSKDLLQVDEKKQGNDLSATEYTPATVLNEVFTVFMLTQIEAQCIFNPMFINLKYDKDCLILVDNKQ